MNGWKFQKFDQGRDTLSEPITSEFFSSEAIRDSADALVREAIQNSLDARTGNGPVRVQITVDDAPEARAYAAVVDALMGGLRPHTMAEKNGLLGPVDAMRPGPYVAIEDFGTSGLEGDPDPQIPQEGATNNFFAFFRSEGWTNKGAESMGRWGIGKTVFPRSSRLNGFLGWTIRASDKRSLLMGRCILRGHWVEGTFYLPQGLFGDLRGSEGVFPVEDSRFIQLVRQAFRLRRVSEGGLTVIVPHIDPEEIDGPRLQEAVVRNYFYPILTGELLVTVAANGASTEISAATLPELSAALDDEQLGIMRLAQHCLALPPEVRIHIDAPGGDNSPKWDSVAGAEERLATLRERYINGEMLAFDLDLPVRRKGQPLQPASFEVFLRHSDDNVSGRPICIREGIVISDARAPKAQGAISIIHAAHGPLATLLGDSENVAHTIWAPETRGFKDSYTYAAAYLTYVKNAPAALVRLIMQGDEEEDPRLLERFFGLDVEDDPDLPPGDRARGGRGGRTMPPSDIPHRTPRYRLERAPGGFKVASTDTGELPPLLRIRVAYDVRRGNPLKQYELPDFNVAAPPIVITEVAGAEVVHAVANEIHLRPASRPFAMKVSGFDGHRDLFVRVDVIDTPEEG